MTLDEQLLILSRCTLHIAYVWNGHNFEEAHKIARETAKECGINNVEEAEAFMEKVVAHGKRIL